MRIRIPHCPLFLRPMGWAPEAGRLARADLSSACVPDHTFAAHAGTREGFGSLGDPKLPFSALRIRRKETSGRHAPQSLRPLMRPRRPEGSGHPRRTFRTGRLRDRRSTPGAVHSPDTVVPCPPQCPRRVLPHQRLLILQRVPQRRHRLFRRLVHRRQTVPNATATFRLNPTYPARRIAEPRVHASHSSRVIRISSTSEGDSVDGRLAGTSGRSSAACQSGR